MDHTDKLREVARRRAVPERLPLGAGTHGTPSRLNPVPELCLMEAVAFVAGERHSDHPQCVSPVLGHAGRTLNDHLEWQDRQALKPLIPDLIGTRDGLDQVRVFMIVDWAVRECAASVLEDAGRKTDAAKIRNLEPITDRGTALVAARALDAALWSNTWEPRSVRQSNLVALAGDAVSEVSNLGENGEGGTYAARCAIMASEHLSAEERIAGFTRVIRPQVTV